jgi:hypothetical protein
MIFIFCVHKVSVSVCLSLYVPVYPSTYTSVSPSIRLFFHSSVHLSVCLPDCMEYTPSWEACSSSACQHLIETEDLLPCSLKLIVPILINRVLALQLYFIFNLILPSTPTSPKCSLSFRFPHHNTVRISIFLHSCYISFQFHSSRFDKRDINWKNNFVFLGVIQVVWVI